MASALSLALHMAECAAHGRAEPHAQGCSAPSIPQMQQGSGGATSVHMLLVSAQANPQVYSHSLSVSKVVSCCNLTSCHDLAWV